MVMNVSYNNKILSIRESTQLMHIRFERPMFNVKPSSTHGSQTWLGRDPR